MEKKTTDQNQLRPLRFPTGVWAHVACTLLTAMLGPPVVAQDLIRPNQPRERVILRPSDDAILQSNESRRDLPCSVSQRKPELGFDLRFHSGYEATIPLKQLVGTGEILTVVFRVYPQANSQASYFVQHFRVPGIQDAAKGDAALRGEIDLGEGKYHVDWLMRDRSERICSSSWETEATLSPKDKRMPLSIDANEVDQTLPDSFVNDKAVDAKHGSNHALHLKLLVNFGSQDSSFPTFQRDDADVLVSIVKEIERDPHVARVSLVAFNIEETRVMYRQESAQRIDFPALGKALESMKPGTVNIQRLGHKHSETEFLKALIDKEMGPTNHPDAVIFAGPKVMLDADVPQDDLKRIGDIEFPVFYLNYNSNPQKIPWKDSISHVIRAFRGIEYTISRPQDVWFSTTEVINRIARSKQQRSTAISAV
jgi:hypothetical protein